MFNSATISFLSCCNSLKNYLSFFFTRCRGGGFGCNKSKLHFLSMAVHAEASTTILLCDKKGRLRIIGEHSPGATIAGIVFEDQYEEESCNCNFTYSENSNWDFCPFFSMASSAIYGLRRHF